MSLHAIDFPHLRVVTSINQPLLYPTAITPTTEEDKDTMSGVQIANGSSDYNTKQQQAQAIHVDIETMRMQLSAFVTQLQSRISIDTVRPLHVFLGLNAGAGFCLSPTAFTPPVRKVMDKATPEKIKSRVQLNFAYFISNYALLAAMTALVIALMHPGMVLFVGIVYLLWRAHEFLIRNPLIVFGIEVHSLLSIKQRFYFLFTITTCVVIWKCLTPTLFFLSISSFMIISHSLLRDPKDVEMLASSSGTNERYNNDSDDDIEGGGNHDSNNGTTTALLDRSIKSPAEKRRTIGVDSK
jgi:hypothetical protein